MAVAAGAAVPFLVEGVRQGEKKAVVLYEHALDVMTRELETYDYVKVTYQGVAGTIVFFIARTVYSIYRDLKIAAFDLAHPEWGVATVANFWLGFGNWISNNVFGSAPLVRVIGESLSAEQEKSDAYQQEVLSDPVIKIGSLVFEDYWLAAFAVMWVFILLFEKHRIDSLKKKRRRLFKMVSK